MNDKLINIKTTAEMLGVTKTTLRNWGSTNELKIIRTKGNHRRYRLSDVLRIMEGKENNKE